MISASEPFEFVPHGRTVLDKHPGKIYSKGHNNTWSENSLLFKMTNFDIKDDSFMEGDEPEVQESWIIREVFGNHSDSLDDLIREEREDHEECLSDISSRPQSRLKNYHNIFTKPEIGGKRAEPGGSRGGSTNSSSNMSKKFNLNCAQSPTQGKKTTLSTSCCHEEELYVRGCTAVWSKGLISSPGNRLIGPESRKTIACYTIENPIKHATFCIFHDNINNTMLIDALNSQIGNKIRHIKIEDVTEHIPKKVMPSILLVDNKCMRVYANDGREYVASIPFQVRKVWPMKYGVLLEKDGTNLLQQTMLKTSLIKMNDTRNSSFSRSRSSFNMSTRSKTLESMSSIENVMLPTCFSMGHPLDEVTPILMKSPTHGCQYYNDADLQIIFVSTEPSIILIYDWKSFTHSLWSIRKAHRAECLAACPNADCTTNLSQSISDFPGTLTNSPLNKHNSTANVTKSFRSKKGSAKKSRSRANSLANVMKEQGMTMNTTTNTSRHNRSSFAKHNRSTLTNKTVHQSPPALPLYPEVCLEHIWTDYQIKRRDSIEDPTEARTFLHTDLVGHNYLCFIVRFSGASKLQLVRLQKSHSHGVAPRTHLIVGTTSSVIAKDAVPLEHLNMIALIDETGNIVLQSGSSIVGKVHVGGVLARLIDSPYSRSAPLQSPFPRRSSLLPSRAHEAAVLDDSAFHLLSPVPHTSASRHHKESMGLQGLCDSAGNCITLKFDKGSMYRINLPELVGSALVSRCYGALRAALPKDVSLQVLVKWYGIRNAPGSQDISPQEEWEMFVNMLYTLIGYNLERLFVQKTSEEQSEETEVASKKQRTSSDGTHDDWDYLLNSKMHKHFGNSIALLLNLQESFTPTAKPVLKRRTEDDKCSQFNGNAVLLPYCMPILYSLHLVYEDLKLNTIVLEDLQPLSKFLYQLARDMKMDAYLVHYWTDLPCHHGFEYDKRDSQISELHLKKLNQPSYFTAKPPSLFAYLNAMWREEDVGTYPYLADANNYTKDIIEVLSIVGVGRGAGVHRISARDSVMAASTPRARSRDAAADKEPPHCRAVRLLCERGVTSCDIDNLPPAVGLYFLMLFTKCRAEPPLAWPRECYDMVMREDLAIQTAILQGKPELTDPLTMDVIEKEDAFTIHDNTFIMYDEKEYTVRIGMEHLDTRLLRLLFPNDSRMLEVVTSLQCSIAESIPLVQMADTPDHDFAENQQKHVVGHAKRTMAKPLGRGMLTLRTLPCVATEALILPKLVISCIGPKPRYMHIELSSSVISDLAPWLAWPNFHNGCAAGLAIVPTAGKTVDASWIMYNKPKGAVDMSNEHAGFLLGLGLNGHLKNMPLINIYDYLLQGNEMVSVGTVLGLAATYRGTMNIRALKVMSIHLEPLLPQTSIELDIQQNILDAALLGVGLIYQGTRHTHYAHVLLSEIGKPPGPDMENNIEREGYALAAGLSLGFVMVGAGNEAPPYIAQTLRTFMLGGDKLPMTNKYKDKYKQGSFAVKEGNIVNLDVTAPGATLALGLIYLKTGNKVITGWLMPPETSYMLDFVRPDLLMLRIIAKGLINWNEIEADPEWVEMQVPESIRQYCFVKPLDNDVDYEAMNQTYCNIVAGSCFALGLRFAGSGDENAKDAILHYIKLFIVLSGKSVAVYSGRFTLETCLCVCLLAAGMVMAGRGDLSILRYCRRMRARLMIPPAHPRRPQISHGAQMAVHMTMGLLFLGGGRLTLSTSPTAIAALITAFFPKFPVHSEDNRYHLQAFRHLYVLATEPRLLLPRELNSGMLCYAHVQVVDLEGLVTELRAPCILPQLDELQEVRICDQRYWPVVFQRGRNWDQLKQFLAESSCIDIKPRSGCLSYLGDREGFLTMLSQTLTVENANIWSIHPETIDLFTNDDTTLKFIHNYLIVTMGDWMAAPRWCSDCADVDGMLNPQRRGLFKKLPLKRCKCRKQKEQQVQFLQQLNIAAYDSVVRDAQCALPIKVTFLKMLLTLQVDPASYDAWQVKLLLAQLQHQHRQAASAMSIDDQEAGCDHLVSDEFATAIVQKVEQVLDGYELSVLALTRRFLGLPNSKMINPSSDELKKILSVFVTYYDLPRDALRGVQASNLLQVAAQRDSLTVAALSKIQTFF